MRNAVLALQMWALATVLALAFAWGTKIGPVLWAPSWRHGLHLGDVVAFAVAWGWAWRWFPLVDRRPTTRSGPDYSNTRT